MNKVVIGIDQSKEKWKQIKGYEGLYEVSSYGRVRSIKREIKRKDKLFGGYNYIEDRILSAGSNNGYKMVVLYDKNGKHKTYSVHKLVAKAFIPNPHKFKTINHLDENRSNNRVENLEWCTQKNNVRYSQTKTVLASNIKTGEKRYYSALSDVEKDGFDISNVAKICRKEYGRKSSKGWRFEYV